VLQKDGFKKCIVQEDELEEVLNMGKKETKRRKTMSSERYDSWEKQKKERKPKKTKKTEQEGKVLY
jgi:hypothetical protein